MFWISFIQFVILGFLGFLVFSKNEVSVDRALRYLKKNLIRMIVFYQNNYPPADQIVLIKKWMGSIDRNKIPKEQLDLFKKYVEGF